MQAEVARIAREQDDEHIHTLDRRLRDIPGIRWKESIKTVIGLPLAAEPGLDV